MALLPLRPLPLLAAIAIAFLDVRANSMNAETQQLPQQLPKQIDPQQLPQQLLPQQLPKQIDPSGQLLLSAQPPAASDTVTVAPQQPSPLTGYEPVAAMKTIEDLCLWREKGLQQVDFIPAAFQRYPRLNVEKQYRERLKQLQASSGSSDSCPDDTTVSTTIAAQALPAQPPQQLAMPPPQQLRRPPVAERAAVDVVEVPQPQHQQESDFQKCAALQLPANLDGVEGHLPVLLMTASLCLNEADLRAWRACQLTEIRDDIPETYKRFAVERVALQFDARVEQLRAGHIFPVAEDITQQSPAFFAVAEVCANEAELRAWQAHQMAMAQKIFLEDYQAVAAFAIRRAFEGNLQRLHVLVHPMVAASGGAPPRPQLLQEIPTSPSAPTPLSDAAHDQRQQSPTAPLDAALDQRQQSPTTENARPSSGDHFLINFFAMAIIPSIIVVWWVIVSLRSWSKRQRMTAGADDFDRVEDGYCLHEISSSDK